MSDQQARRIFYALVRLEDRYLKATMNYQGSCREAVRMAATLICREYMIGRQTLEAVVRAGIVEGWLERYDNLEQNGEEK